MSSLDPASSLLESLPDELLLFIFKHLSPFQRALLLPTCRNWNHFILLNTQLWNNLTIPQGLPLDLVLTILRAFNSRSNFKLKQVVIETFIKDAEELDLIFEELKKSADSLQLLALVQDETLNFTTRKFAMQFLPILEALLTKEDNPIEEHVLHFTQLKKECPFGGAKFGKVNLKIYVTDSLMAIDKEDQKWLTKLIYLAIGCTDSISSLHRILRATPHLIDLDCAEWVEWGSPVEDSEDTVIRIPLGLEQLCWGSLRELILPYERSSSLALDHIVKVDGELTLLAGLVASLVSFNVKALKALWVFVYTDSELEAVDFEEPTKTLLKQHPTIETLTLECPYASECSAGGQLHLNKTLEILNSSVDFKKEEKSETVGEVEEDSSSAVQNLILPRLVKLVIKDPVKLDRNLLRQVIKGRSERNSSFKFEFIEDRTKMLFPSTNGKREARYESGKIIIYLRARYHQERRSCRRSSSVSLVNQCFSLLVFVLFFPFSASTITSHY